MLFRSLCTFLPAYVYRGPRVTSEEMYKDWFFKGEGVQEGIDLSDWSQIRRMAYEGHGG